MRPYSFRVDCDFLLWSTKAPAKTVAPARTEDGRTVLLKDDGTYENLPGTATPPTPAKVSLDIETGLVFTDGSVVPATRTTFIF